MKPKLALTFFNIIAAVSLLLQSSVNYCQAQTKLGEILPNDIAESADISVLAAEADVFNTIKKGVTLSLAMCEGVKNCSPTVTSAELEQILNTLKTRIDNVTQRYEQSGDKSLEEILVAYADARESYTQNLEKLKTIVVEEPAETTSGSDFFGGAGSAAGSNKEFSIFNDTDKDLQDDEEEQPAEAAGVPQEPAAAEKAAEDKVEK